MTRTAPLPMSMAGATRMRSAGVVVEKQEVGWAWGPSGRGRGGERGWANISDHLTMV